MHTKLLLIGLLLLSLKGMAQLNNPSFEDTDSLGLIADWQLLQGKATRVSVEQFGIIPFTAYAGNYFTKLESDTNPIKVARFTQTFALTDTPASFYLHHLYLPENTNQTAGVYLLFTKWNGSTRDTILFVSDSVEVVANGNQVPIQWNRAGITLRNRYRLAQLPDTATIELTNDRSATGTQIRWYVDDLSFGKWPVGLNNPIVAQTISVYPNPASDNLWVKMPLSGTLPQLFNMLGEPLNVSTEQLPDGTFIIHTQSLPNGMYLLYGDAAYTHHQLICIIHP